MANNNAAIVRKNKKSTNNLIDDAIAQQNNWLNHRRNFTRKFLKNMNAGVETETNAKPTKTEDTPKPAQPVKNTENASVLREYWFPIMCALIVLLVAIWTMFVHINKPRNIVVSEPTVIQKTNAERAVVKTEPTDIPTFDIVRVKPDGMIVVAGRWQPDTSVSVLINDKIVATEQTNKNGEFVYAPSVALAPGNYTLGLVGTNSKMKSQDKVFLYISDAGSGNSMSLLMTPDGSRLLQAPTRLIDGDLMVSKIDYLDTGRIVVTGDALPRLRVSLSLDDKYLGFARVSEWRHFGLGADVGNLTPGQEYKLTIRLHDGDGQTIATVSHDFIMPEMTGDNDTFYTVRRGDCLWVIARNFLRRGVLFSIIAERNNIDNPNLIFPEQLLQIPLK